jgi:hypothetical protein
MIHCEEAEFAKYDLTQLGATLTAPNVQKQTQAIDDAIRVNHLLALSSVCALRDSQDRFFVAERLPRFGSVVVEPLEALLQEPAEGEAKILASLVLLGLGSQAGVPILLDALLAEPAERYASLVARTLAANGVGEAGEIIITRLRSSDLTPNALGKSFASNASKDLAVSLLDALKKLAIALPTDLQQRLKEPNLPVEVRSGL